MGLYGWIKQNFTQGFLYLQDNRPLPVSYFKERFS